MINEKLICDKVHQLTDTLLRLERYLANDAQCQVYCGKINNWKREVKVSLLTINDQIKNILEQLK